MKDKACINKGSVEQVELETSKLNAIVTRMLQPLYLILKIISYNCYK